MCRNRLLIALSPAILASLALSTGITTEAWAASPPAAAAAATPSKAPMDGDNGDAGGPGDVGGGDIGDNGIGGNALGDVNGNTNDPTNNNLNNNLDNNLNNNINNNVNNNINNNVNDNVNNNSLLVRNGNDGGGPRVVWLVPSHPQNKCVCPV